MLSQDAILKECTFKATRSSGAGGQHVNKVATKIELYFNIQNSSVLSIKQKEILISKLKLTKDNTLVITSQDTRSQYKNKLNAIKKLFKTLANALKTDAYRIPTRTPKSVKLKRLKDKKNNSERKANRQKPNLD